MIDGENGLLPIALFDAKDGWDALLKLARPHLDAAGLDRLKAAADLARCVAVEHHYIDKDYRDTFSHYYSKRFSTPSSRCIRLHFFRSPLTREQLRNQEVAQAAYLGYSVIRPIRPNCVGRTLLAPDARATTLGAVCLCEEKVSLQGLELSVEGFPFISQDAEVNVCAQAALWMLVRYFSNRYRVYPETYPYEVGDLTRDYSIGRLFPTAGLFVWQMAEALRQMGFSPVIYSRDQYVGNFDHLLYTYIESGFPVFAGFQRHVVVMFGHLSDYGGVAAAAPAANSPFIFSSAFNTGFVGNDDNGIPYQLLHAQPHAASPQVMSFKNVAYQTKDIQSFVVPLPEKVFLPAEGFEKVATTILGSTQAGYKALSAQIASAAPLLRLFLTTGQSFKKRLSERGMGHATAQEVYRNLPLPHFIWVCEISHPSIYPGKVLGEIIWDATRNAYEPDGWIALHYPEVLVVDVGSALNGPQSLQSFKLDQNTAYPVYRSNLKEIR
ncbi:MAG: hypothetical protein ACE15C_02020 [Phycisphaerae bacterium]